MDLSPSAVRRKTFEMVRRGYDPQEVGAYLEALAERVAEQQRELDQVKSSLSGMEGELSDAKAAEEALQMTMIAATQAKDEMLSKAKEEAERMVTEAEAEAKESVESARRQALELLETSRREAEGIAAAAKTEHAAMLGQVDVLRDVVARSRTMLVAATEEAQTAEALIEQAAAKTHQVTAESAPQATPVAEAPVVEAPVVEAPVVEVPVEEVPVVEADQVSPEPAPPISAGEAPPEVPVEPDDGGAGMGSDEAIEVESDAPLEVVNGEVAADDAAQLSTEDLPDEVDRLLQQLRSNR